MAVWGEGLFADDTAREVSAAYRQAVQTGLAQADAELEVLHAFREQLVDMDDGPVVWLALAYTQSVLGAPSSRVRERALDVMGLDLERWEAYGRAAVRGRADVLARVRHQLERSQAGRHEPDSAAETGSPLMPGLVLAYRALAADEHT